MTPHSRHKLKASLAQLRRSNISTSLHKPNPRRSLEDAFLVEAPVMPAYFFHIAFELYPSRSSPETTFTPPQQTNIFTSELPAHSSISWSSLAPSQGSYKSLLKPIASSSDASRATHYCRYPAPLSPAAQLVEDVWSQRNPSFCSNNQVESTDTFHQASPGLTVGLTYSGPRDTAGNGPRHATA